MAGYFAELESPWDSQPQGVVEIDRYNPLGKTVTHCIPLNGINREIVTGAALTLGSGGSITPAAIPRGAALSLRGTGSTTRASIPIDLSPYTKLSLSFWMYWDAFANDDALALEYGANYSANSGFIVDPNSGVPALGFFNVATGSPGIFNGGYVTRPSAAAWHHYVVTFDRTTGTVIGTSVCIDGALVSSTALSGNGNVTDNFGSNSLYLFSRNNTALWGTGNLCNIVIRGDYLMLEQEARAEYLEPWQIYVSPPIDIWTPSAGGGTSIALTGTAGTGAVGNLTTTLSVPLTNVVGTGAVGTVTAGTVATLTGVAATGAVGNLTTTLSSSITGTAGTGAVGNLTTTLSVPITGVTSTGAAGNITTALSRSITNVVGTGAVGTITTALSVALTGVTSTGAAGTVTPSAGTTIALTNVAGTGAVGNLTTTLSTPVTGVVGTGAVGTVTPGAVMALTGVAGTGAVGSVATTLSTSVTGVAATGAVGNLTTTLSRSITGTAGTGAVGSVVPGGTVINLSGVAGTGAVGTFASTIATQLNGIYAPGLVGNVSYAGAAVPVVFPPGTTFVASTWQETRVASTRSETTL